MEYSEMELVEGFKALSDINRIKILKLLQYGEKCACVLIGELGIGQSALSYHMKILCSAGIVNARQEGKWIYYSLKEEGYVKLATTLEQILKIKLNVGSAQCEC